VFVCCAASQQLTLAVSELLAVQPQLSDSPLSQSKIHIRVRKACRIRLVEYFHILAPSNLETDDAGKLLTCVHFYHYHEQYVSCGLAADVEELA